MEQQEYESVRQIKGSMSQQVVAGPAIFQRAAFERAIYIKVLSSFDFRYAP